MTIGLIDVDTCSRVKKWGAKPFPNLALAKISRYHKQQGDSVEWYTPFAHYDVVYMAKVFNFTPDYSFAIPNADKVIRGGTGYDIKSKLPEEIDRLQPDYSIYPHIPGDYAYGFLTRGCPNRCPWCVVPKKEGAIVPYMDVDEIAIEGRHKLVLMDNNILAAGDYAVEQLHKIIERGYRVDFNQALDARLVTEDYAKLLAKVKWLDSNRIRFGCDTHGQIDDCEAAIERLERNGFHGQIFLYTMMAVRMILPSATAALPTGGKEQWMHATTTQAGATPTPMRSPTVIQVIRAMSFPNGRRTWPSGATSDSILSPSTFRNSLPARDSIVKNISLNPKP